MCVFVCVVDYTGAIAWNRLPWMLLGAHCWNAKFSQAIKCIYIWHDDCFFTAAAISSSSFSVAAVCCFFTLLPASPSLPTLPCSVLLLLVVVVIQSYLDSSTFSVTTYFYARQFDKISGRRRDQNNEEIATTKRVKTKQIKNQTRIGTLSDSDSDSEPNTYACMYLFAKPIVGMRKCEYKRYYCWMRNVVLVAVFYHHTAVDVCRCVWVRAANIVLAFNVWIVFSVSTHL